MISREYFSDTGDFKAKNADLLKKTENNLRRYLKQCTTLPSLAVYYFVISTFAFLALAVVLRFAFRSYLFSVLFFAISFLIAAGFGLAGFYKGLLNIMIGVNGILEYSIGLIKEFDDQHQQGTSDPKAKASEAFSLLINSVIMPILERTVHKNFLGRFVFRLFKKRASILKETVLKDMDMKSIINNREIAKKLEAATVNSGKIMGLTLGSIAKILKVLSGILIIMGFFALSILLLIRQFVRF